MTAARFFLPGINEASESIVLGREDSHHAARVLRLQAGDALVLCDGRAYDYPATVDSVVEGLLRVKIIGRHPNPIEKGARLHLWQALPKSGKMEEIIQKSVELGVYCIHPMETERCQLRVKSVNDEKKLLRWNKIAEAAAKQSGRGIIPRVLNAVKWGAALMELEAVLQAQGPAVLAMLAYEDEKKQSIRSFLHDYICLESLRDVHLLIGSEGGFTEAEAAACRKSGLYPLSLGQAILRTETAGPAVLAMLNFALPGRM